MYPCGSFVFLCHKKFLLALDDKVPPWRLKGSCDFGRNSGYLKEPFSSCSIIYTGIFLLWLWCKEL